MSRAEWSGDLKKFHPICEMTADFVLDVLAMHNRSNSKLFLAFDGWGGTDKIQVSLPSNPTVYKVHLDPNSEYALTVR
jgi:hypothetical protein